LPSDNYDPPLPPVTVKGMGGLTDVTITSYEMSGDVPADDASCPERANCGVVMAITATVTNPSPFGLVIGTMNAQVLDSGKVPLGFVTTSDLTLSPGENTISMTGMLKPDAEHLDAAAAFMCTYLQVRAGVLPR
jgi:hypothetical protein